MALLLSHQNIPDLPLEKKRDLIRLWNVLREKTKKPMTYSLLITFIADCFLMMATIFSILYFVILLLLIFGYALINEDRRFGYYLTLICYAFLWTALLPASAGNVYSAGFILVACVYNLFPAWRVLVALLNYRVFDALSKEAGFPCFLTGGETAAFADQIYLKEDEKEVPAEIAASNPEPWSAFSNPAKEDEKRIEENTADEKAEDIKIQEKDDKDDE